MATVIECVCFLKKQYCTEAENVVGLLSSNSGLLISNLQHCDIFILELCFGVGCGLNNHINCVPLFFFHLSLFLLRIVFLYANVKSTKL